MGEPAQFVQFGNYLLDEEIARGGMARVYRARLRGLGGFEKTLVVKQVLPELAEDPRFVEMFVAEAKVVVQMSHPHIVPVYELGVVDGVYFLAMEYIDGATLTDVLRAGGALAPQLVAHVGAQVCDALHYAHTRFDLVHRDITPRNVIMDATGHSRLLDFGIAAPAEGDVEAFGSPGYMSPEQYEGAATRKGDLFAVGAVLFEAVSGRPAFLRTTEELTREAVISGEPPRLPDDVPSELAEIIREAMSHNPDERPASAEVLGRRLRGWLAKTHPQGVGPELGERVEAARASRKRPEPALSESGQPLDKDKEPSRIVRTLATSPMLEAMLEGQAPVEPAPEGDPMTVPIERAAAEGAAREGADEEDLAATRRVTPSQRPRPDADTEARAREGEDEGARRGSSPSAARVDRSADEASHEPEGALAAADGPRAAEAVGTVVPRTREPSSLRRLAPIAAALAAGAALAFILPRLIGAGPGADPAADASTSLAAEDAGGAQGPDAVDSGGIPTVAEREDAGEANEAEDAGHTAEQPDAGPARLADAGRPAPVRDAGPSLAASYVSVNSDPWATVTLDGRRVGNTPVREHRLTPGQHTVTLTNDALGLSATRQFQTSPGQRVTIVAFLSRDPPAISIH